MMHYIHCFSVIIYGRVKNREEVEQELYPGERHVERSDYDLQMEEKEIRRRFQKTEINSMSAEIYL